MSPSFLENLVFFQCKKNSDFRALGRPKGSRDDNVATAAGGADKLGADTSSEWGMDQWKHDPLLMIMWS